MNLIKPKFEILEQQSGIDGIYKMIELAGRTCYRSEDKITPDSAKGFVERMIKSGHCYTGDTEILTENGWIKFKDYNSEKVAVINKDCSFKGFENPKRIVNYSYKGNFYYYPSLGIEVTDGHNMFGVFRESKNNFYKNDSYSLFKCNEYYKDNNGREKTLGERMFKTPRHCLKNKSLNPYGELIGFWLGDGCYSPETKNKLIFHLKKQRKIEYLKQLCEELGYTFEKRKSNYYTVTNDNIGSSFNSLFYNNGKKIPLQYFPSIDIAYSIINGLINSNGSLGINTKTITFSNTNKSIIDWLLMYAPICGYSISDRGVSHNTTLNNPVYKVLLLDTNYTLNNDSRNKDSKVIITNKVEEVYCVTVSTGLIMVRGTNGITTICGNCAMLEHGTVYLFESFNYPGPNGTGLLKYKDNKYSKFQAIGREIDSSAPDWIDGYYVTTNLRVLVENNWMDDLQYICEPTKFHEKRICVRYTSDIHFYKDCTRHRVFSWAIESTRFCNYIKSRFGSSVSFATPIWLKDEEQEEFEEDLRTIESIYFKWINKGWQPQQAAYFLIQGTKAEVIMTGFVSDYKHFFDLRSEIAKTGKPHPTVVELVEPLRQEFIKRGYING